MPRSAPGARHSVVWEEPRATEPAADALAPLLPSDTPHERTDVVVAFLVCTVIYISITIVVVHCVLPAPVPLCVEAVLVSVAYWQWISNPFMWQQVERGLVALGALSPRSPAESAKRREARSA